MPKREYGHGRTEEMEKTDSSSTYKRILRLRQKCAICRPNRGENNNYHKPRTDKYKSLRKGRI